MGTVGCDLSSATIAISSVRATGPKMLQAEPLNINLPRTNLGEGIHWRADTSELYWVDITSQRFHAYAIESGTGHSYDTSRQVSFVLPCSPTQVWLGLSNGLYLRDLESGMEKARAHLTLPNGHRLNDGKCDPQGRLWVGTINTSDDPSQTAALYRLDESTFVEMDTGFVNANGKAWSPDGATMYHADTDRGIIWQYDYGPGDLSISNKRVFANLGEANPDGLAIDCDGNVYAALYGDSTVIVLSPRGERVERIELPVPNPTSCAFGGADMGTLFITSASHGMDKDALRQYPLSGHLFKAEPEVRGMSAHSLSARAWSRRPEGES